MKSWDDLVREFYDGVRPDGSRPALVSKALIEPLAPEHTPEPLKGGPQPRDPNPILQQNQAREVAAEKEHVERVRKCVCLNELLVDLGIAEATRMKEQPAAEEPVPEPEASGAEEPHADGTSAKRADKMSATRAGATPAPRVRVPALPLLTLAARAAKDLPAMSADLLAAEKKWLEADSRNRVQGAFYLDRAVALVTDLFFHMDEQFAELGFGNWMPFRYPDQWCMFVGLLSRILAAHGLMPAEPGRAEIYRKLLDETPPINDIAETAIRPPKSYGKAHANREFPTLQALQDEVFARAARANEKPP